MMMEPNNQYLLIFRVVVVHNNDICSGEQFINEARIRENRIYALSVI